METENGIDNGKPTTRRKRFDLFRPVSVKPDGRRIESPNWCVRFQHQGKRTCRTLGTADYRLATQRAKLFVASVRQQGWSRAAALPSSQGSLTIEQLLEQFCRCAVARGLRPRSIASARKDLRRITRELGARRLSELTPEALQSWIRDSRLKPITLRAAIKNAAVVFSRPSLQSLGMTDVPNPFAQLVRPKVDREPFTAPPREWIQELMRQGIDELRGEPRLAFVLALGAGLRWGEIISLPWEEVQPGRVRISAEKAKGRRARLIPIGKRVQGVLERARGQGTLIASSPTEVHDRLCTWLREHGVKDSKPVHYLRKCFGSLAVADHGIFIGSKLLGHASIGITASTYAGQVDKLPAVRF